MSSYNLPGNKGTMNKIEEVNKDIEQILINYGSAVLSLDRKYPVGGDTASRFNAFETAREKAISQIRQLFELKPDEKETDKIQAQVIEMRADVFAPSEGVDYDR